jgi:two-component system response regulator AtoC
MHDATGLVMDTSGARVLVAEDDFDMRAMIAAALRADGYEVVEAANGIELLDAIATGLISRRREDTFDVVLSDVRMPRVNGIDVVTRLRRAKWSVPVVIMTASGDETFLAHLRELGIRLLEKPFDLDDLRGAIAGAISPPS